MLLTDKEIEQLRSSLENNAGYDDELLRRCASLIHLGAYDEAVRSAFILLEERLRTAINEEGMTGSNMANYAFSAGKGPLAKKLGISESEKEGLRELFSGAFKLFRNPSAHGTVGYDAADSKAIIGLVNLLLGIIKRAEDMPPLEMFPENVDHALQFYEDKLGPGSAGRLRTFLGKCLKRGLIPVSTSKQWVPFKCHGLVKFDHWEKPKSHSLAVFYISSDQVEKAVNIPTDHYYSHLVDFDLDYYANRFIELGFRPLGKRQELYADLRLNNDEEFFQNLYRLIVEIVGDIQETLGR